MSFKGIESYVQTIRKFILGICKIAQFDIQNRDLFVSATSHRRKLLFWMIELVYRASEFNNPTNQGYLMVPDLYCLFGQYKCITEYITVSLYPDLKAVPVTALLYDCRMYNTKWRAGFKIILYMKRYKR